MQQKTPFHKAFSEVDSMTTFVLMRLVERLMRVRDQMRRTENEPYTGPSGDVESQM